MGTRWAWAEMPDGEGNPKCRLLVEQRDDKQFLTDTWICFEVGDSEADFRALGWAKSPLPSQPAQKTMALSGSLNLAVPQQLHKPVQKFSAARALFFSPSAHQTACLRHLTFSTGITWVTEQGTGQSRTHGGVSGDSLCAGSVR